MAGEPRSPIKKIFVSPDENRLRSGWRILLHFLLILLFMIPSFLLVSLLLAATGAVSLEQVERYTLGVVALTYAPAIPPATFIARRFLDKKSFRSLGFTTRRPVFYDLLVGFLLPGAVMGLVYLVEGALGWLSFQSWGWNVQSPLSLLGGMGLMLLAFIAVGFYEELMFRGYYMQNLKEGLNLPWALFLTSFAFGLSHMVNPNARLMSAVVILLAGLFLGFAWWRTRELWLPIGLHIGWNFFEGPVFGYPVSGLPTDRLIHHSLQGPEIITGGAFGPEAGLILIPPLILATLFVWWYTRE